MVTIIVGRTTFRRLEKLAEQLEFARGSYKSFGDGRFAFEVDDEVAKLLCAYSNNLEDAIVHLLDREEKFRKS